jgi:hypothetical protein
MIQKLCDITLDHLKLVLIKVQSQEWVTNSILIDVVIIVWRQSCTSSRSLAIPLLGATPLCSGCSTHECLSPYLAHPLPVRVVLAVVAVPMPIAIQSCPSQIYWPTWWAQGWNQQWFSGTVGVHNELPGLISFIFTAPNKKKQNMTAHSQSMAASIRECMISPNSMKISSSHRCYIFPRI